VISAPSDGLTQIFSDINFPGVVLLATSGVVALFFIVRWMIRFQRDFTNFYVDENNKQRERIDQLESEAVTKEQEMAKIRRDTLEFELTQSRKISELETRIARQDDVISDLRRRLGD
jgi:hypothetical protein